MTPRLCCLCLAVAASCGFGCSSGTQLRGMPIDPEFVPGEPAILLNDWLCVPGVRCGPITAATTLDDLLDLFGEENVVTSRTWVAEGTVEVWASSVNAGTDDEFRVCWAEGDVPDRIGDVQVTSPRSRWHTEQGVRIGTTLEELNEINGVPFYFYGFDWDYGGRVSDWCGGSLEGLQIRLSYCSGEAGGYVGDAMPIRSDDPGLEPLGVAVGEMDFTF